MYHLVAFGNVNAVVEAMTIVQATQGCISAKWVVTNHDPQQSHLQNLGRHI